MIDNIIVDCTLIVNEKCNNVYNCLLLWYSEEGGDEMTKDAVLAILKQASDFISGEEISQQLSLSRAAIHMAVKTLRSEGYAIESGTNKGYKLLESPDHISRGELLSLLPLERLERITCFDSLPSTNTYLSGLALEGAPEGQVILANHQTAGKGRLGRSFHSPQSKGIYLSLLLRPSTLPADTACITAWVAVATIRAIEKVIGIRPNLKWVNDIILNNKKVGGILTEMSIESESGQIQHLIVGIGLNVNHDAQDFPPELCEIASSLFLETGKSISRAKLTAALIESLDQMRLDWPSETEAYYQIYRQACISLQKEVVLNKQGILSRGFAEDIDENFGLIIKYPNGKRETLRSGEVQVRGLHGYV